MEKAHAFCAIIRFSFTKYHMSLGLQQKKITGN